jgi:hypothetical protein
MDKTAEIMDCSPMLLSLGSEWWRSVNKSPNQVNNTFNDEGFASLYARL